MSTTAADHRIVVGVDGSQPSRRALSWATEEAVRRRLSLYLVHSYQVPATYAGEGSYTDLTDADVERIRSAARHLVDDAAAVRQLAPRVAVTTQWSQGSAAQALVEASRTADTIVLGARGRGSLTAAVLGSVSTQVAMHALAPVVVLKDREHPERPRDSVVVGTDGSPGSQACLAYAFQQAASRGTTLQAVYVWSADSAGWIPGASLVTATHRMETKGQLLLAEALAGWAEKYPGVQVRRSVVQGDPVSALVECSDGAQLIVVGSRGRGSFAGLVLGSVSHGVLHEAGCPVAVVRGEAGR
jgi:nucleotide-binding universal stress UspA family protein